MWETFSGLILDQNRRNEDGLKELKTMLIKTTKKVMEDKECTCPIFRALENKGLRWNPETEEIEEAKARLWRAKRGEYYISLIIPNEILYLNKEDFNDKGNELWESGNYFRTTDEAKKYVDEFKRILKERTLDNEV